MEYGEVSGPCLDCDCLGGHRRCCGDLQVLAVGVDCTDVSAILSALEKEWARDHPDTNFYDHFAKTLSKRGFIVTTRRAPPTAAEPNVA